MTETVTHWTESLREIRACDEAVTWAEGFESLEAAWAVCERGDWMLWLAGKTSGEPESAGRKALVLCACACARLALAHVPEGEMRPLRAIETAERWARGEATISEVREARRAADAAAYAAADAAAYAADAAARATTLRTCADLVRQHYPVPPALGGAR